MKTLIIIVLTIMFFTTPLAAKVSIDLVTVDGQEYPFKNLTGAKWRLVHDTKKVLALIEGTDKTVTTTMHSVEEFDTRQAALDRIEALNLEYVGVDVD